MISSVSELLAVLTVKDQSSLLAGNIKSMYTIL